MILIPGFSSSDAYMAAQAFLMRNFSGRFEKYIIPCFVASGQIDDKKGSESLSCRYLQFMTVQRSEGETVGKLIYSFGEKFVFSS